MFSKYIDIAREVIEQHDDLEYTSLKIQCTRYKFLPDVEITVRARHVPTDTCTHAKVGCEDDEQQVTYAVDTAAGDVVRKLQAQLEAEAVLANYSADEILEAARKGGLQ